MKNTKIKLLFLILISVNLYSIDLDNAITQLENQSYTTEKNKLNIDSYEINRALIDKGEWNGVTLNVDNKYYDTVGKSHYGLSTQAEYGIFNYRFDYDTLDSKVIENRIGVSKDLKELYYSQYDSQRIINDLSLEAQKVTNQQTLDTQVVNLIDLYKNYKNKEKEIEVEEKTLEVKKRDYNIIKRKFELGTASEFDHISSRAEYEKAILNLDNMRRELLVFTENFKVYNVILDGKFDDIKKRDLEKDEFYNIGVTDLKSVKLNEKVNVEKLRREKYETSMPELNAEMSYSFENEEFILGLGVKKTLFNYKGDYEQIKNDLKKNQVDYLDTKANVENRIKENMIQYTTLQTNELISQKDFEVKQKDYEVYNKKYELGMSTYSDYLDRLNALDLAAREYEKAKNELASFTYKIKYMN
ncbi:TolC family protein [Sebaldella sp. S0638]|uniref:TolC family protein n=1 Tax=Sebaldella sp. S0638 TaxID=2957809 RepID=UPI00209EFA7C|nr:TolC family protein [Sebaldella sp. S0638]